MRAHRVTALTLANTDVNVELVLARVEDMGALRHRAGGKVPGSLMILDAVLRADEYEARAVLDAIVEGRLNLLLMEEACQTTRSSSS